MNSQKRAEKLVEKGILHLGLKKYSLAVKFFNMALEMNPKNIGALLNKGYTSHKMKNYEGAIACYDMILQIDPKNTEALEYKGMALEKLGKHKSAMKWFRKAARLLKIRPSAFIAQNRALEKAVMGN